MFERFTSQSRRAVVLAQEEARDLHHDYIGSEHLLLGMLREGTGSAARALTSMNVTLDAARQEVEASVGRGQHQQRSGPIPFAPRAKEALEQALRESLRLGQNYIGTGHLLLGLIKRGDDVAIRLLGNLHADVTDLRARAIQELADDPEHEEARIVRARPARVATTLRLPAEARNLLEAIEARLGAIERRLEITRGVPDKLRSLDEQIAAARRDKDAAIDARDFDKAARLRDAERDLLAQRTRVVAETAAGEGMGAEAGTGGSAQAGGGHDEPGDPPAAAAR
ncbi:MAG TPA: Clp protease N-terminal domain-containing protein [Streptosporangiaceae bacterium]|nr:Clp protease N-terminal domain-containing protein [Streptosporangiaceae bacterium]